MCAKGAMGDEAKRPEAVPLKYADPDAVKKGDLLVCHERYVVMHVGNDRVQVRTIGTDNPSFSYISKGLIKFEFMGTRATEKKKVSLTRLQEILTGDWRDTPMEIKYRKKRKRADARDELSRVCEEAVKLREDARLSDRTKKARLGKLADKILLGEERTMVGCRQKQLKDGRVMMFERTLKDDGATFDATQERLADPRTLEEITVCGVTYVKK